VSGGGITNAGRITGVTAGTGASDAANYGQLVSVAIGAAMAMVWAAVRESIFEKSYMTGARDLIKAVFAEDGATAGDIWLEMLSSAVTRAIPLSGTTSQVNATIAGNVTEAVGFMDRLFKVTPGLGAYLPARVDALGNDVEGRVMGLAAGTTSDTDPLTSRMAALGIDITNLRKADPAGFDLTGEELSELRRIRATEATNSDGQTMREALEELLDDPEFSALPSRDQKQAEVVEVMSKFNQPARELFEERNQAYLADREGARSLKAYIAEGIERHEAARMAREDVAGLGLPEPARLPR